MVLPSGTMNSCSCSLAWQVLHLKTETNSWRTGRPSMKEGPSFATIFLRITFLQENIISGQESLTICQEMVWSVLWIRIGFNADPDPEIQTNADPCRSRSGSDFQAVLWFIAIPVQTFLLPFFKIPIYVESGYKSGSRTGTVMHSGCDKAKPSLFDYFL